MQQIILFDGPQWKSLFPLTLTRPCAELRCGILTIKEKWERIFGCSVSHHSTHYLRDKYCLGINTDTIFISGAVIPNDILIASIRKLKFGEAIFQGSEMIATRMPTYELETFNRTKVDVKHRIEITDVKIVTYPEHLFLWNGEEIKRDFNLLKSDRQSQGLHESVSVIGDKSLVFVEEGVSMFHAILNTVNGPIYIGRDSTILEGCMMRGPLSIGDKTVVKMGAKIYGNTSIGPRCKIGGEIKGSVFIGNSSKGHDGYVGDSVVGEWCNFGADTNTSNMKNTYGAVSLYDISANSKRNTGEQFCGLIMGDHVKCAINTQFNTGTVAGVGANIFGLPPTTYIPSFSWGVAGVYEIEKAIEVAHKVYRRRHQAFLPVDQAIFRYVYENYSDR